jgi:hypothetical protein
MNQEQILEMMRQQFGQRSVSAEKVPVEKLDEFIDRCTSEEGDFTPYTLAQAIQWKLYGQTQNGVIVLSFEEEWILPQVLQRLQERFGDK